MSLCAPLPRALESQEPWSQEGDGDHLSAFGGSWGRTWGRCCHLMLTQLWLCRYGRCWDAGRQQGTTQFISLPHLRQQQQQQEIQELYESTGREREHEVPLPRLVTSLLPLFFFFPVPIKNLGLASNFPAKANQTKPRGVGEKGNT